MIRLIVILLISLLLLSGCDESFFMPETFEISVWKSKSLMKADYEYYEDTGEYGGSITFSWRLK